MDKQGDVTYHETTLDEKQGVAEVKTITGADAFNEAMIKEPPRPWAPRMFILYFACLIGG